MYRSKQEFSGEIGSTNVRLRHNLFDMIGNRLVDGIISGDIDRNTLGGIILGSTINLDLDFDEGYGLNIGRNVPSPRGGVDDYKVTLRKDIF